MANPTDRYVTELGLQQPSASDLTDGVTGTGTVVLSASPALTGSPTAPTQTLGDNTTKIATDAFVQAAIAAITATGGVNAQTSSYLALSTDNGKLVSMNGTSLTLTLPATPPSSTWFIFVENINSSSLTVSRNGLNIDGAASNLTLTQNQGVYVTTNGTNYFTSRGVGSGGGGITLETNGTTNGSQTILNLIAGTGITLSDNGSGGITITATGGGGGAPTTDVYVLGTADYTNLANSVVNPTAAFGVDVAPVSAGSLDDEFNGSTLNTSTRWTWVNQSTATATVKNSILNLIDPASSPDNWRVILQTAPATPWEVTCKIRMTANAALGAPVDFMAGGIILTAGNTSASKLIVFGFNHSTSQTFIVLNYTNYTTFNSGALGGNWTWQNQPDIYLKVKDDGTNLLFSWSFDGVGFTSLGSVARTAFLPSGPAFVGLGLESVNTTTPLSLSTDWFRRTL